MGKLYNRKKRITMNKLEERLKQYKKQVGPFPTEYQNGYIKALTYSIDTIGSCFGCKYSQITLSGLKCKFYKYELEPDGYCNHYIKKDING